MELRSLTRFRVGLSNTQTSFKNRVHKILQLCNIRLASKLSDIFGKSGLMILDALMKGGDVDEVVEKHAPKRIRAKKVEIKASIMGVLNQSDLFELKICLEKP